MADRDAKTRKIARVATAKIGRAHHEDPEKIGEKYGRRPSVEIAKDFVELNIKAVIDAEDFAAMTPAERKKRDKEQRKLARKSRPKIPRGVKIFGAILLLALVAVGSAALWWQTSVAPVNAKDTREYQFTVADGATSDQIGATLQKAGLIRNSLAFGVYARLHPKVIKAGDYQLSPSWNLPRIFDTLAETAAAQAQITIPPGVTLDSLKDVFA